MIDPHDVSPRDDCFGDPDAAMALLPGAFAVARVVDPDLDPQPYLVRIEAWGDELKARIADRPYPMQRVRALVDLLFLEGGLQGNKHDYYDPRNSCLNDVMDRGFGIPISLSVLAIAVAERAGLTLEGVGFPGHFLVRYVGDDDSFILIDPFHGGEILMEADCLTRLRTMFGPEATLEPRFLKRVDERQIILRMLLNLKGIYLRRREYPAALAVVDRLLAVDPGRHGERRDKGMLLLGLRRYAAALAALEDYLVAVPQAVDADGVRRLIQQARSVTDR